MLDIEHDFDDKEYWEEKIREFSKCGFFTFNDTNSIWKYFKHCLQTQNRFFFENPLISLIIQQFNDHVFMLPKSTKIYRARIDEEREYEEQCWLARKYVNLQQYDKNSEFSEFYKSEKDDIAKKTEFQQFKSRYAEGFEGFDAKNSEAPPFDKVNAGRCNPEYVVFLYASNDEHTAAAEVRPYIRDAISLATLSVNKDLRLVDFYYEYNEEGVRDIDNIFFDKMRNEFSLLNKGNKDEYLTTQYLSLLAQHQGFDGIRFRSSLVDKGANYVIFNSKNCKAISSKMYIVKKVEYDLFPILLQNEKDLIL